MMPTRTKLLIAICILVVAGVVGGVASLFIESVFGQFLAVMGAATGVFGLGLLILVLAEFAAPIKDETKA